MGSLSGMFFLRSQDRPAVFPTVATKACPCLHASHGHHIKDEKAKRDLYPGPLRRVASVATGKKDPGCRTTACATSAAAREQRIADQRERGGGGSRFGRRVRRPDELTPGKF